MTLGTDQLHDGETQVILDVLEDLRRKGIEEEVQLPRLAVAGDTSTGKSKVLERITGIPFPSGDGVVTRFATEVAMRPAAKYEITVTIAPDQDRNNTEARTLQDFRRTMTDLDDFGDVYEAASKAMGLCPGYSVLLGDVLRIDIRGPDCTPLTIIDLPGLIHATSNTVSDADLKRSHEIVEKYLQSDRTIILAIISASNEVENQAITQKARVHDPEGYRTMGIITKPDTVVLQPEREQKWIDLAQNQNIALQLGWHVLMNKAESTSAEAVDKAEAVFFAKDRFAALDEETLGLAALKPRISKIVYESLILSLPQLQDDFNTRLQQANMRLRQLGRSRDGPKAQRAFMTAISNAFQVKAKSAFEGNYSDGFFRGERKASSKLRAEIQTLNLHFARAMRLYGASKRIDGATSVEGEEPEAGEDITKNTYLAWFTGSESMKRDTAIKWVLNELQASRGSELPGTVNPVLVKQLYGQMSIRWESLADEHLQHVLAKCEAFVDSLLAEVLPDKTNADVRKKIFKSHISPSMADAMGEAKQALTSITDDERQQPLTYNQTYITLVQKARNAKNMARVRDLVKRQNEALHGSNLPHRQAVDVESLANSMEHGTSNADMDRFAAEDTLDQVIACYYTLLNYFIDAIAKQVIERHIIRRIPELVTPEWVIELSDEELKKYAAEPEKVTRERKQQHEVKSKMEYALKEFREKLADLL